MKVKICGVTRPADAALAAALGADLVGMNFWPGSKRFVSIEEARAVAAAVPAGVTKVGVFVNAAPDDVMTVVMQVGLDLVQLHGDETPEDCARLPTRWMRALRVAGAADLDELARYPAAEAILLDAPSTGYGGSGRTFDWTLAARAVATSPRPIFLAGGLTPENVAEAVARVRPHAVDVAGGVESAPAIKDPDKLRRFIENARKGDAC
jgi:phosphoribosylanthranilate isomerase